MKLPASAAIAAAGLLVGGSFAPAQQWMWAAASLIVSAGWLAAVGFGWQWTAGWGLAGLVMLAAVSAGFGASPPATLAAVVLSLAGWDLHRFGARLATVPATGERASLLRRHLGRLAAVVVLGLIFGGIGLAARMELNLTWAIFWSVLLVASLSWAVTSLKKALHPRNE